MMMESESRRSMCGKCSRPSPVCLCGSLPAQPIPTRTQIIILHHPHEAQHKLSTTPVLTKCLSNSTAIVGRRLKPGISPVLDQSPSAVYLFPPTQSSSSSSSVTPLSQLSSMPMVLIAFDATWKHAGEMVSASEGYLSKFARRVCLDLDVDHSVEGGSIYDSDLILRKEPFGGCVTTMEAVARALRVIEPNGQEIETSLLGVLRDMVALQTGYLNLNKVKVKYRPKLFKKGKQQRRNKSINKDDDDDQTETSAAAQ